MPSVKYVFIVEPKVCGGSSYIWWCCCCGRSGGGGAAYFAGGGGGGAGGASPADSFKKIWTVEGGGGADADGEDAVVQSLRRTIAANVRWLQEERMRLLGLAHRRPAGAR